MTERLLEEEPLPPGWEEFISLRYEGGRVITYRVGEDYRGYVRHNFHYDSQGYVYPPDGLPGDELKVGLPGSLEQAIQAVEERVKQDQPTVDLIPRAQVLRQARAYEAAKHPEG